MKFIITGGGTGGHIYPALAIAEEIKKIYKDSQILYIGTEKGLESEIVPKTGIPFKAIRVKGMPRKLNKASFIAIRELLYGLGDAKKIIKDFKPDIVIGTGGYVCGPMVYIAAKKKIPTLIHEQNAYPGITNKILSRYVDKVLVTFDEAKKFFKYEDRVVNTGNPIRKEILETGKDYSYDKLNIKPQIPFILSFGGSGGQKKLNDAILELVKSYNTENEFQLIHVTGSRFYGKYMEDLKEKNIKLGSNIRIMPYLYDIPEALSIANLVITSAGAITLAELSAIGIPSILIPKAYTAENHQEYNARSFEEQGASIMILEKDLEPSSFKEQVLSLIKDKDKLHTMSKNCKRLGKIDATKRIIDEIDKLIK